MAVLFSRVAARGMGPTVSDLAGGLDGTDSGVAGGLAGLGTVSIDEVNQACV
jgi:hypothetical protein